MAKHTPADFLRLLNLVEDYYRTGFRRTELSARDPQVPSNPPDSRAAPPPQADQAPPGLRPARPPQTQQDSHVPLTPQAGQATLESIAREVSQCTKCPLHRGRTHTVPGEGSSQPLLMCIGEGPGAEEDRGGRPFVGPAGQYLDRWLGAIDLDRKADCFIGNIVKCRPPGNRDPLPDESGACIPYLQQQIQILRPKVIVGLGRIATQILLGTTDGIGVLRGRWFEYNGIPLLPTFHPSAVLRNSDLRRAVWEDMKKIRSRLDDV